MPMPARVIRQINSIGARERQGREFRFLNRRNEPYEWTDEVQEDDPEFQGLLDENEDTVVYPDIGAELPGVELEEDERDFQTVTVEPEPEFLELAGTALHYAGIDATGAIRRAQENDLSQAQGPPLVPPLVEADDNELVYEITLDIPDAGLLPADDDPGESLGDESDDTLIEAVPGANDKAAAVGRRYPSRARRSVIGNQLYDTYAPRTTFLQLGTVRAHRSVLEANRLARMTKEERLMATTMTTTSKSFVDDTTHRVDREMCTRSEDELGVMAYLMTQYNLKPGLQKFGSRRQTAAVKELTQLHIMDTWTPIAADKLSREQRMRALSLLLFLKEKWTGDIKGRACINGAPQRAYISKEDAASPTVSTESTFITATIAASKGRRVRCYDVPSAFINTDVEVWCKPGWPTL